MRKRLANGRAEELLDGVLRLAAAEGFSGLKVAHFARELHCSVATLYKLAPTKFDLICVALERWGAQTLLEAEARSLECSDPSSRARTYYRTGAERVRELSPASGVMSIISPRLDRRGERYPMGSSIASPSCSKRRRIRGRSVCQPHVPGRHAQIHRPGDPRRRPACQIRPHSPRGVAGGRHHHLGWRPPRSYRAGGLLIWTPKLAPRQTEGSDGREGRGTGKTGAGAAATGAGLILFTLAAGQFLMALDTSA